MRQAPTCRGQVVHVKDFDGTIVRTLLIYWYNSILVVYLSYY